MPGGKGVGSDLTIGVGCEFVSAGTEVAIDERVGRKKALSLTG
jgi:hypothetical protein